MDLNSIERGDSEEVELNTKGIEARIEARIKAKKRELKESCMYDFIKKKFNCIVLLLLIVILALEIFKATVPALSIEDQQQISKSMLKAAKSMIKMAKKHFNLSASETQTHDFAYVTTEATINHINDLITSRTTTTTALDDIHIIFNVTNVPEYGE